MTITIQSDTDYSSTPISIHFSDGSYNTKGFVDMMVEGVEYSIHLKELESVVKAFKNKQK